MTFPLCLVIVDQAGARHPARPGARTAPHPAPRNKLSTMRLFTAVTADQTGRRSQRGTQAERHSTVDIIS